jgi:glutamate-5-semialdehyde dehydrogenase
MMTGITDQIKSAKLATVRMSVLPTAIKNDALSKMADALDSKRGYVIEENRKDLKDSEGKIPGPMYKRMMVDDAKVDEMVRGIKSVMSLEDPVGGTMSSLEMDDGLMLYQVRCPVGMLGVVFESRPDVVPQIMSLCLKSGNCVAFKGGSEARRTIKAIFDILREAVAAAGIPDSAFVLLESRDDFKEILDLDEYIDLLIPRGSNSFVRYVQENTRIPVLGHAAGICHVYIDSECDQDMALEVAMDSKIQYPAVCNAVENILVDSDIADVFLPRLISCMKENGVEIRGDDRTIAIVPDINRASEEDWYEEYDDLIIAIKVVDSLEDAIEFINSHSSHHTEAIITNNMQKASVFVKMVDSADVFVNASTRFADGYRFGKGAEVGISTNKIHARGPMGMEGLMIYKYVLVGSGQVVKDYVGKNAKQFKHIRKDEECPLR